MFGKNNLQRGMSSLTTIIIVVLVIAVGSIYFLSDRTGAIDIVGPATVGGTNLKGDPVSCPADAFQCPDGTVVYRLPPACTTFAPCPRTLPTPPVKISPAVQ